MKPRPASAPPSHPSRLEDPLKVRSDPSTISVVLCTYNGGRFLREQLESLAAQTTLPSELVVGDDGSQDDTLDVVRQFARHSPFPVTIHENRERLGYRRNFLATAQRASGDYIAFCDQDDVWHPDKLRMCLDALRAPSMALVVHAYLIVDADLREMPVQPPATSLIQPPGYGEHPPVILGFTQVYHRSLIQAFDLTDLPLDPLNTDRPMAHDQWVSFAADLVGCTRFLPDRLALYRQHGANVYGAGTGSRPPGFVERLYRNASQAELRVAGEIAARKAQMAEAARLGDLSAFPEAAGNLAEAIRYWRKLADSYAARSHIRGGANLMVRARRWVQALRKGAYDDGLAATIKLGGKDLVSGVLFPKRP